jgi:tetratricopeptide (TPR) repeat protein
MLSCRHMRKRFLCFVFSLLIASAFAQQLDEWTVSHFDRAMRAQQANDLQTTENEYRLITTRDTRFAGAFLNLGIVFHQQKRYADAVSVLKTTVRLDPQVLTSQLFLGIDEYLTQDFKDAHDHLRKALAADPKDRQAGLYLGFDYLAQNQPFHAIEVLRQTAKCRTSGSRNSVGGGRPPMRRPPEAPGAAC